MYQAGGRGWLALAADGLVDGLSKSHGILLGALSYLLARFGLC